MGHRRRMTSPVVVPITLMTTNNRGLRMEKIDHYIKERADEPEHKSMISSIVGATSKENKLNAARRIKLYVEAGEDLAPIYNEFNAQLTDKGELRRIYDEYKVLRENTIDRMNSARNQLPESLRNLMIPQFPSVSRMLTVWRKSVNILKLAARIL